MVGFDQEGAVEIVRERVQFCLDFEGCDSKISDRLGVRCEKKTSRMAPRLFLA